MRFIKMPDERHEKIATISFTLTIIFAGVAVLSTFIGVFGKIEFLRPVAAVSIVSGIVSSIPFTVLKIYCDWKGWVFFLILCLLFLFYARYCEQYIKPFILHQPSKGTQGSVPAQNEPSK